MHAYVMGMNVLIFCLSFWTALIYGVMTSDWFGSALWVTVGFGALTSARLTPPRAGD